MPKRKSAALLNSDSDEDSRSSDSGSDTDKDMLSLAKKNKGGVVADRKPKLEAFSSSSSSDSDSDSDTDSQKQKKIKRKPGKRARRSTSGTTQSSMSGDDRDSDNGPPASEAPSSSFVTSAPAIPAPAPSSVVSSTMPDIDTNKNPSDLEEGEVSDEDVSDNDSETEEFNDGYDDNLMGDDEDQRRLSAMTEKEREQEIYKRIEQRELLRGRFEMEKKLRMKKKLEAKLAKRGLKRTENATEESVPDEFQMDAKVRSQERKKTVEAKTDKKSQAMDLLKASRDAKIQRQQEKEKMRMEKERRREEKNNAATEDDDLDLRKDDDTSSSAGDKKIKKLNTSDVYSDDSASDYETEVVTKKEKKKSISDSDSRSSDSEDDDRNRKPQFVEKVEDLNKIRLSRFKMERWLYLPFFPRVLKGCFVRLGVQGPRGTKSTYDVCEVMEIQDTSKVYQLGNTRTNKGIRVRHGNGFKVFRFEYVSNQDFTQEEFNKWKDGYENLQIVRPTLDEIEKKVKEIKECLEYQLKEEDIESIITEKAKFKRAPVNFAAKKTQLMKEKEISVMNGDDGRTKELTNEIQELDDRAKELDKARTSTISAIGYINERNRKKNVEEAEKAILEELKSNKGKKVEDPFTRRNTKPRIVSKPISGLVIGANMNGENLLGVETVKLENGLDAAKLGDITLVNNSVDMFDGSTASVDINSQLDDDDKKDDQLAIGDLFSAHDFDIKLDLDAKLPPNLPIVARPSMTPIKDTAPRRSLNLEEYKRKKGLI